MSKSEHETDWDCGGRNIVQSRLDEREEDLWRACLFATFLVDLFHCARVRF